MQKYCIIVSFFAFFIVTSFCVKKHVSDKIVLRIGKVTVTQYELEKNLDLFTADFISQHKYAPSKTDIKNWINQFVDHTYFLADAYDKGYDTSVNVNKWVYSMSHYVISKPEGLLYKKMNSANVINEKEVDSALLRNSKRIYISYLKFLNYDSAISFLKGGVKLKNKQQFRTAFDGRSPDIIEIGKDILQWPFFRLGESEETILSMKKGEISALLPFKDGIYIVRIDSIVKVDGQLAVDSLKNELRRYLEFKEWSRFHEKYLEEVKRQAQIKTDSQSFAVLEGYLDDSMIHAFDKKDFPSIYTSPLFYFKQGDTVRSISTNEFADYYNTLPIRTEIRDVRGLVRYIESFVYDQYAYAKASSLGVTKGLRFLLDKKNYLNNVIWSEYKRKELKEGITVSNQEILKEYEAIKDSFFEATDVVLSAFAFDNRRKAFMTRMDMRTETKPRNYKGIQVMYLHKNIHYNDNFISDSIRDAVFSMKHNGFLRPVYFNGKYIVIVKESESGRRIRSMSEVRTEIEKMIVAKKLRHKEQSYLMRLKKVYRISNEINYQKYMNV